MLLEKNDASSLVPSNDNDSDNQVHPHTDWGWCVRFISVAARYFIVHTNCVKNTHSITAFAPQQMNAFSFCPHTHVTELYNLGNVKVKIPQRGIFVYLLMFPTPS
jgi:hypothetical protein